MKYILSIFFFLGSFTSFSQSEYRPLSIKAQINLITIGPGEELYEAFGHTAIQVKDPYRNLNIVFNYGVFDYNTPNFYLKFARGKLLYKLEVDPYKRFEYSYKSQQRWIKSQELNLAPEEKNAVFWFLMNNQEEANKYYKYDFFYDNCATRPFYAIASDLDKKLEMDYDNQKEALSHRDLIHQYIPWNSWGSLGIDVALGSVIDRPATPEEYLFLPNELMDAFAKAKITTSTVVSKPLVLETKTVFTPSYIHTYGGAFLISPFFILSVLALLILYKTYRDFKQKQPIGWLDKLILLLTGIIGVLVAFLWFGTDHTATAWNYNLLWAFPFHIIASFVITQKNPPQWIYPYMKLATILMTLLFFHWMIGVQKYALALLPLFIAIAVRYLFILKKLKAIKE